MSKQIVSIEIELKNYEPIKFTMDEARELYEQLHSIFGEKEQHNHYHEYPWWNRPYYTWINASGTSNITTYDSASTMTLSDVTDMSVSSSTTGMKVSYLAQ